VTSVIDDTQITEIMTDCAANKGHEQRLVKQKGGQQREADHARYIVRA
jgi:hypothetical protein